MLNIQEITLKIKNWVEDAVEEWWMIAIVLMLGFASFGLGRLSTTDQARPAVSIREAPETAQSRPITIGGLVVASRNGSVYHYPWCPGAEKLAERNKVWFKSAEAARAAGYLPAKNCKGLK